MRDPALGPPSAGGWGVADPQKPVEPASADLPSFVDRGLPASYCHDLDRAVEILRELGCTEVYLFGSLARGAVHPGSDIDLAIRGCPPKRFFRAVGRLLTALEHPTDLVDLDCGEDPFARRLLAEGSLVRLV